MGADPTLAQHIGSDEVLAQQTCSSFALDEEFNGPGEVSNKAVAAEEVAALPWRENPLVSCTCHSMWQEGAWTLGGSPWGKETDPGLASWKGSR